MNASEKKLIVEKLIIHDKINDYFEIYELFNLKGIVKFSNLLFSNNFLKLELQFNSKNFYSEHNKVGFIPFIYNKRKIILKK